MLLLLLPPQLVSVWATSTLSPWQQGEFIVACWPYYPWTPILIELLEVLTPDDRPPMRVNPDSCEAAKQAAVLAAELGLTNADAYIQERCGHLAAQLEWVMQDIKL